MAARKKAAAKRTPPWKKKAPRGTKKHKLTPAQLASAKKAAKKAGRKYPNLIDNMQAAQRK